jgi:hypothetical protein
MICVKGYEMSIICICGSTKFKEEINEANKALTLEGHIVLAPSVFGHSGDVITEEQKEELDKLHLEKIKMADEVFVVNPNGYIGDSTKKEIEYANKLGKFVSFAYNKYNAYWEKPPVVSNDSFDYIVNGAVYGCVSLQADDTYMWTVMVNPKCKYGSTFIEGLALSMEGAKRIVELICQETDTCYPRKATK